MREALGLPCAGLPHSAAGVVGKAGAPSGRDRVPRRRGDNCRSIAGAESCPVGYARELVQDEPAHIELAALAWARAGLVERGERRRTRRTRLPAPVPRGTHPGRSRTPRSDSIAPPRPPPPPPTPP